MHACLKAGQRPCSEEIAKESVALKTWWGCYDQLLLSRNGVIYFKWEDPVSNGCYQNQIVAVPTMYKAIMQEMHDSRTSAHLGQTKTIARVKTTGPA